MISITRFSIVALVVLLFPFFIRAESVVWSEVQPDLVTPGTSGHITQYLYDASVQITYKVQVWQSDASGSKITPLSSGATVPIDSHVLFEFIPHEYTDIYWFGTGGGWDSPYGDWQSNAEPPPNAERCAPQYLYAQGNETPLAVWNLYASLAVVPPSKQVSLSGIGSCQTTSDGVSKLCVANTAGPVSATFTFQPTSGKFYGGAYRADLVGGKQGKGSGNMCSSRSYTTNRLMSIFAAGGEGGVTGENVSEGTGTAGEFILQVPQQSVPFTLTVGDDSDTGPSSPSLSSGASCVVGTPHTITMTSTDPDGDQLRYLIDWNDDGTADQTVPGSGYVNSGTSQNASRTYTTSGSKTVRVMAQDDGGATSAWSTTTFSCADAPEDEEDNEEGDDEDQIPGNQCTPAFFCQGNDLYSFSGAQCTTQTFVQSCSYACTANGCIFPPAAGGNITATPSLVSLNDTATIAWTTNDMVPGSCLVSENNPLISDTASTSSGSFLSSPLVQQTIYTLSCLKETGGAFMDAVTVNILPLFQED